MKIQYQCRNEHPYQAIRSINVAHRITYLEHDITRYGNECHSKVERTFIKYPKFIMQKSACRCIFFVIRIEAEATTLHNTMLFHFNSDRFLLLCYCSHRLALFLIPKMIRFMVAFQYQLVVLSIKIKIAHTNQSFDVTHTATPQFA